MSVELDNDTAEPADDFAKFAAENREWLEEQADSDDPAAWVAQTVLNALEDDDGGS